MIAAANATDRESSLFWTRNCYYDGQYLYHTARSIEGLLSILCERTVRTGEFSTWTISGLSSFAIRFWKDALYERGVRPVWWWSKEAPPGFVAYSDQYTFHDECGWVQGSGDQRSGIRRATRFELEDVDSVVVFNRYHWEGHETVYEQPPLSVQIRKALREAGLDIRVDSMHSNGVTPIYVPRGWH